MRTRFLALFVLITSLAAADPIHVDSPDRRVSAAFTTDSSGHLVYSIAHRGKIRLQPAPAGIIVDDRDLGANVSLGEPRIREIAEEFPWRGSKSTAMNRCRVAEIPVRAGAVEWLLEVRAFDDGAAFRYRVPGNGSRRIGGESTRWQLPGNATLWFQTDTVQYEGEYHAAAASAVPLEQTVAGKPHPVFLGPPVTAVFADGGFGLVSEANLFRYSGLTLRPRGSAAFEAAFEDDPSGWTHDGEVVSPWRVIILADDLDALVNSDVIPALAEPPDPAVFPDGILTPWIKPGKAPCTWMVFDNAGAAWERQRWWVDRAAATGCEYLLVDAGWRSPKTGWMIGGDLWGRVAELCRYAAARGVGIFLWHAYTDDRDDGPGLKRPEEREEFLRQCRDAGVKGVKIDFFNSESRAMIDVYEELLRLSARHQLMINFHGTHKPTGEARTWPHEVTREGLREQEYVLWDQLPLSHYGSLPFTRMVVGHGDFLPGYVRAKHLKNTAAIFQMAAVVVFSSPFLCWPDHPDAYLESPLLRLVRDVPVTWEETRVLPGSVIGEAVLLARRRGADWYLAVLNCRNETQSFTIDLTPFAGREPRVTLYRDALEGAGYSIEPNAILPADGKMSLTLRSGGGFVAHLAAPREFETAK